ncbi:MAG: response regulator [Methanolinea sp.]|jgi:CheY-like chemotaxis protein|nr:response regulator [Methanolinea sp.]
MDSTILLVDDNKFIVDGLKAILSKKGYHILVTYSGEEALDLMERTVPDLILLDISMEPIDGWETLERARRRPESAHIPVIIFSARKTLPEEARRKSLGVADVISKPINTGLLIDAIERTLKGNRPGTGKKIEPDLSEFHINIGFERHLAEH